MLIDKLKDELIISTSDLVSIMEDPNVKILDCSGQYDRSDCTRLNFMHEHI